MLPKTSRNTRKKVEEIFKKGRFTSTSNLSFKFIQEKGPTKAVSVVVPKNVAKSSVNRNALRRRGYGALKKHWNLLPDGVSGTLILKNAKITPFLLEEEIKKILNKIK